MSQKLLDHSTDLQKLVEDGYELEIRGAFALVHHIPYVNQQAEVLYGTLVSPLSLSNNAAIKPETHVIYFIGEHPCDKNGDKLSCITHQDLTQDLGSGIIINHSFSNKPIEGYKDYYEKFVQYIKIISAPALSIDRNATAQTYCTASEDSNTVFQYHDTNSSRASITAISEKLASQNIGIIGLGGSGSYVLDLVSKCPVQNIHLYDADHFYQHNAFRAPGAADMSDLNACGTKAEYFHEKYSHIHKNIHAHNIYIDEDNVSSLNGLNFVFICIDKGDSKKIITQYLIDNSIPFIDTGIGVTSVENFLLGQVRSTLVTPDSQCDCATYLTKPR
ncbi:MAG: ThiF family adenylyltransferase [Hungatella hathewayi]|nr:ThiF family adenylyltransferase [Hungatella hathewayi]